MFCTLAEYYPRFKEYSVANKQKDIFQKIYAQIMQFIFTNIYHMQLNSRWIDFHLLTHILYFYYQWFLTIKGQLCKTKIVNDSKLFASFRYKVQKEP